MIRTCLSPPSQPEQRLLKRRSRSRLPAWRSPEFYRDHDIEVLLERPVTQVEPSRILTFADGSSLFYDALLLATGGLPRQLDLPGKFPNVLRP